MFDSDIQNRVNNILKKALNTNARNLKQKKWDSLTHISLITTLEEEFKILLEPEDIIEMVNYENIISIVQKKLNNQIK